MRPPTLFAVAYLFSLAVAPLKAQKLLGIPVTSAVGVDSQAMYLAGYTMVARLATTAGAFQPTVPPGGCTESITGPVCTHGFVAKVSPSGDRLEWASYLTGAAPDSVSTLAVAGDGNVYVAGTTTSTTLVPGPGGNTSGAPRLFMAKLSTRTANRCWRQPILAAPETRASGSSCSTPRETCISPAPRHRPIFPPPPGAYQRTLGASPSSLSGICKGDTDEFVDKFDPALKSVLFSTLVGSPAAERTDDFAIGPDGSLYIAETIVGSRELGCGGLLTRLNPQGSAVVYSVYLFGYALAVDSTGAAYIATDDRVWGAASPQGTVFKIDSHGNIVARAKVR